MNWYIITKRQLTRTESFKLATAQKADQLAHKFGLLSSDMLSSESLGLFSGTGYDDAPELEIKTLSEYPDEDALKSYLDDLKKNKRVFAVQATNAEDAIQTSYMYGFLYSGERSYLFETYPDKRAGQPYAQPRPVL